MFANRLLQRILSTLVVGSLLFSATTPALNAQSAGPIYLPVIANGAAYTATNLVFRTRVTVNTQAQWQDLTRLGAVILAQGADWALVMVDDEQLADLARLRFTPTDTNALETLATANTGFTSSLQPLLAQAATAKQQLNVRTSATTQTAAAQQAQLASVHAALRTALQALDQQQRATLLAAASVDSDADGLTDDQEGFWCTDAHNADSDGDHVSDGNEIKELKAWMNNQRYSPPGGTPWADWPFGPSCPDKDNDSVPNLAETLELGLNADLESTDHDQFDDGQELFGTTKCPGSATGCGYGSLPPANVSGIVLFPQMPSWVKPPGNHPLVAALPVITVDVAANSLTVERVTEITTSKGQMTQRSKSYSTAETKGTSTANTDTHTWNDWQEVSVATPIKTMAAAEPIQAAATDCLEDLCIGEALVVGSAIKEFCEADSTWGFGSLIGNSNLDTCGGIANSIGNGVRSAVSSLFSAPKTPAIVGLPPGFIIDPNADPKVNGLSLVDTVQMLAPGCYIDTANNLTCKPTLQLNSNDFPTKLGPTTETQDNNVGENSTHITLGKSSNQPPVTIQKQFQVVQPQQLPVRTTTSGHATGGAFSTTTSQYEEQTVTNGEAFTDGEDWHTASAVNSAHAADLRFTYNLQNIGTDFARHVCEISFNIYIGDHAYPDITYDVAPDLGGDGCLSNIRPDLVGGITRTSRALPLSLDQMRAIDLGGPIRIVAKRYVLSTEDYYIQDALNSDIRIAIEDGTDDGDESIETYLIPTWKPGETVLQVLARYFPNEIDAQGNITAIWTPESRSDTPIWCQAPRHPTDYPTKAVWCKHALSTADWWNVYTDGLGNSSNGFQGTTAVPGAVALFRFNKDSDHDGFSDRSEQDLGTDLNDAASFPHPELLAGMNNIRSGNKVTSTLSLLNQGLYDAYGIEAVMIAPNDSISITNNTVGGSGRVRALKQVIVGSSIQLPTSLPSPWTPAGHAQPGVGGYYTGQQDRTYTLTVQCSNASGCTVGSGAWTMRWTDTTGASGNLNFGSGYASPTFLAVGNLGVNVALYSGTVTNGDSFTVAARTPRDTFQYTINREPHTDPLVIVSYNDPQGNHRFMIPSTAMSLTLPTQNLQQFRGQMLQEVGVNLVTSAPFTPGANNTVNLLVNNPSNQPLTNAHLFLEMINISGTVVAELPKQVTLAPGPTFTPITFNSNSFQPAYDAKQDYVVMAFVTDYQGNILDTAGRPLSSFQVDPLPKLTSAAGALTWSFGPVAQGALLKQSLALANVGVGRLYTYFPATPGLTLNQTSGTIGAADVAPYELTLNTASLPVGAYDKTITLTTSDPVSPTVQLRVQGTVTAATGDSANSGLSRPLDVAVTVTGTHSAGEWVNFSHNLGPDSQSLQPVKVYSQDYGTLLGVGKYATNFGQGTASADMFGDGRDGVMPGSGNLDNANGAAAGIVTSGSIGSSSLTVADAYNIARINPGDVVLIHQTQGSNAGCWEMNKAVSDFGGGTATYQLAKPLQCNYATTGSNHAQIVRVPQYSTCNVTGTVTPLAGWNGNWGGIFAVICNGSAFINGAIANNGGNGLTATNGNPLGGGGAGFRGGQGDAVNNDSYGCGYQGEGTAGFGWYTSSANGNGGGAGCGAPSTGNFGTGGGGGNGENGSASSAGGIGAGGLAAGNTELTNIVLGGGGAGSNDNPGNSIGSGGGGGGIIILMAKNITLNGSISANGGSGGGGKWGAGGGAGGSVLLRGENVSSVSNQIYTIGGNGGSTGGGRGAIGRIRIEYCNTFSGSIAAPASTQKLNCYLTEQTSPNTVRLNLPAAVSGAATYNVQFGRMLTFTVASSQVTTLSVPAGLPSGVQLDALVSGLSTTATLSIDIGNDGVVDWSGPVANNSTNPSPDLSGAFTTFWRTAGTPVNGALKVPLKVTLSQPGQVLLTNLRVQTIGSRLRTVRLPVKNYTNFQLDFTTGMTGTVALDLGNNGSIDWNTTLNASRQLTANLKDALNAYLAGKSGVVDVPLRFYLTPLAAVTLNDFVRTWSSTLDLSVDPPTIGNPTVQAASVQAASMNAALPAGAKVPVQAVVHNLSPQDSGPVTVAFFANATGWGDWYLGSTFLSNISANGTIPVNTLWNTTGFSGTVPVKVVINPYKRTPESVYTNNSAATNAIIIVPKTGDINGDGLINVLDLQRLIKMILNPTKPDSTLYPSDQWQRADLNQDQAWNILDLQKLINLILAQ